MFEFFANSFLSYKDNLKIISVIRKEKLEKNTKV